MAQVTTEGREFWLGFMENDNPASVELEIYLSSRQEANVVITAPRGNFRREIVVPAGTARFVSIPANEFMPVDEGVYDMGLKVTSDIPISVYALNKRQFSADAAVILPTTALGKEYFVTAHAEPNFDIVDNARESELLIVAVQDDTEVEITPSVRTASGKLPNNPFTVTLNAGETYLIKSALRTEDLSGTYVRSVSTNSDDCKNIAVFGGNVFTNVGGCGDARDHLLEQMFPISTWGKSFLYVPYETRLGGDYVKIIASEDNTVVNISGNSSINLDRGEVYKIKALNGVRSVESNKPISFAQFSRSQQCDGVPSDPFFILVSPLEQRIREVTFNAFSVDQIDRYYLTMITEAGATAEVFLDNVNVGSEFTTFGNTAYTSIEISQGNHTIKAPEGVIAFVYGYGNVESFGYSAGVALENLNLQIEGDDEYISIIDQQACLDANIEFSLNFTLEPGEVSPYNTFEWDFGDGTTDNGEVVNHTYEAPGFYNVILTASDGQGSCGNSETVVKTIEVQETEVGQVTGPLSVCPDVDGIEYTVSGGEGNSYQWFIEGGEFDGPSSGESVMVNWGAARTDASIKVLPSNSLGCLGDTLVLPVTINKRLEPIAPFTEAAVSTDGLNSEVCDAERLTQRYFLTPTNGSVYKWFVEGGDFIETMGTGDTEVFVKWEENVSGKIWYLESNPLIAECEGYSDTLNVRVYPALESIVSNSDVLCNGGASGTISLDITGGKPGNYQVEWDNGKTGKEISDLRTGNYTATITDELGCQITTTVTIGEPERLQIVNVVPQGVSCFQDRNGVADLQVIGGTPLPNGEYTFNWQSNGFQTSSTSHVNSRLPAGDYVVSVTDANGCQAVASFTIDEPPLLEADLESLINDPICPQASDGTAFIDAKGGTPDYQFYWSNKPTTDDANASDLSQGAYSVRIVDANGCETSLEVDVTERFPKIFFPTAFSPNGDSENETFKPVADCQVSYYMQIYNKWGQVIFSTEDLSEGWDGTYQGDIASEGKYSYVVFYAGSLNEVSFEETYRGSFDLIR
ncbi:MAG: gliding motility-associated C-terminal domain-containing protein [Roseivirga sp.]|uniref:PKD domain-containing protein n=1 Tax=Roseivirga sp. TaxID=1964215 RepID=UPI001B01D168|nr:PKD domain-containing protein [Roseivirga sp.]MBO6659679.1 gliding motility-associated C-terminal domain-containing protein [Roseivirga sp.]MBO6907584.1 gliding motility-associated C-terminal domain-containing protein [Roseivirga sp.]